MNVLVIRFKMLQMTEGISAKVVVMKLDEKSPRHTLAEGFSVTDNCLAVT